MTENNAFEYTMPHPQGEEKNEYNTTREKLKLPEYGRLVQNMVEYALKIEDRNERQAYAEAIVDVMIGLNPKMKDVPDFQHKIWDHLAYIADYKLDIDYPFEITEHKGIGTKPERLSYPKSSIRFRHYGRLIEKAISELKDMPEGEEKEDFIRLVANRMKRNLADWKGDGVQDSKVARDIAYYTEGKVQPNFSNPGDELMTIGENRFRTRKNKGFF
mgnify:FL=1